MRAAFRSFAVAFAVANLYLLYLTGPLVSPEHQLVFHLPSSAGVLFAAVLVDLAAATLLLFALLEWSRRRPRTRLPIWAALLLPLPWVLVETVASFSGTPAARWLCWSTGLGGLAVWALVLLFRRRLNPGFCRLEPVLGTLLSFVALSGVVILAQLIWLGWKSRGLNAASASAHSVSAPGSAQEPTQQAHVIWIILDELSSRQVYGHRFPGLQLPNFDRLAAQSTLLPNAVAAAQYTRIAVPSLLTGLPLSATNPTGDGRGVLLHVRGEHGWHRLDQRDTVFGDAFAQGLPTAIAGWYEPYCRVLPEVLNRCVWTYSDNLPGGLSGEQSVLANALELPRQAFLRLAQLAGIGLGVPPDGVLDVQRHASDYRELAAAGDRMLTGQKSGLLLLHMPIPHPWGFYDRRSGRYPGHRTSYLDNLVLADAYLGHVMALLQAEGAWDNADVIVMGDHGWRVRSVWMRSGFWTAEDQAASRGAAPVDPPAMIVKLHGQHSAATDDARFDAVRTRALINALLAHRLQTPADLERWVAQIPGQ